MPKLRFPTALLVFAFLLKPVFADYIIDQSSVTGGTLGGYGIIDSAPLTQTFTPTVSAFNAAEFLLSDSPTVGSSSLTLELLFNLPSVGTAGATVLASSIPSGQITNAIPEWHQFQFSSAILLTPGNLYGLRLVPSSSNSIAVSIAGSFPSPYTAGEMRDSSLNFSTHDVRFTQGFVSVPEPTNALLASLSIIPAVLLRRRKVERVSKSRSDGMNRQVSDSRAESCGAG